MIAYLLFGKQNDKRHRFLPVDIDGSFAIDFGVFVSQCEIGVTIATKYICFENKGNYCKFETDACVFNGGVNHGPYESWWWVGGLEE